MMWGSPTYEKKNPGWGNSACIGNFRRDRTHTCTDRLTQWRAQIHADRVVQSTQLPPPLRIKAWRARDLFRPRHVISHEILTASLPVAAHVLAYSCSRQQLLETAQIHFCLSLSLARSRRRTVGRIVLPTFWMSVVSLAPRLSMLSITGLWRWRQGKTTVSLLARYL